MIDSEQPRRFGRDQKTTLYLANQGRCSLCGEPLAPGWHGDHVVPYSIGGATDVINGQATCPTCNMRKGNRMLQPWPDGMKLRPWQESAYQKYLAHADRDFLLVATPGAGKTTFALRVAHDLVMTRRVSRVIVVVPTEHLKIQWARAADAVGLNLDPYWTNDSGNPAPDYHGIAVAYSSVGRRSDMQRYLCRVPTLVILDEIHHAGDENTWGDEVRNAYEHAERRLAMSGTPFRTGNNPIAFVRYEDGVSRADFSYSYGDALADGICRSMIFPKYDGEMRWYSRGRERESTFATELIQEEASRRLRTALVPDGQWIREVLRDADNKLSFVRDENPDAGGLVVAMDRNHANAYGDILRTISGERPAVVTCDDPDASEAIGEFARSGRRWIVAIRMVSEGVDIPRLRVGVYATNIVTEMFVRQVIGRFVRGEGNAYLYIPADPAFVDIVQRIKEERNHQLEEEMEAVAREYEAAREGDCDDKIMSLFLAISSTGMPDGAVIEADHYSQIEINQAEEIRRRIGAPPNYDAAILARFAREMLRDYNVTIRTDAPHARPPQSAAEPHYVIRDRLRRLINKAVGRVAAVTDRHYRDVYGDLMRQDGCTQEQCSNEQLRARLTRLENWLREADDGG